VGNEISVVRPDCQPWQRFTEAEPESTFLFAIYAKGTLPFRLRVDGLLFAETE
jgi:hypothetical protein